jgi:hypothetical protein
LLGTKACAVRPARGVWPHRFGGTRCVYISARNTAAAAKENVSSACVWASLTSPRRPLPSIRETRFIQALDYSGAGFSCDEATNVHLAYKGMDLSEKRSWVDRVSTLSKEAIHDNKLVQAEYLMEVMSIMGGDLDEFCQ